jgi:hypothetical protein
MQHFKSSRMSLVRECTLRKSAARRVGMKFNTSACRNSIKANMSSKAVDTMTCDGGPKYVAVCDVLGFSNLVETTPLDSVRQGYEEIIDGAMGAATLRSQTAWPDGRTETRVTPLVGTAVFSDSIIVWSSPR